MANLPQLKLGIIKMANNKKIEVLSTEIKVKIIDQKDYICLTDYSPVNGE
jgi:hypothetical protein